MESHTPILSRKLEASRNNLQMLIRLQSKPNLTEDQRRKLAAFIMSAEALVKLRTMALAFAEQNDRN